MGPSLTDTREDSKLVQRRKRPEVDTLFSSLFFRRVRATSMTQRRVENTRLHFWSFSPVSVNSLEISKFIFFLHSTDEFAKINFKISKIQNQIQINFVNLIVMPSKRQRLFQTFRVRIFLLHNLELSCDNCGTENIMSGSIIIQENPLKSENKNFQGLDYKKA